MERDRKVWKLSAQACSIWAKSDYGEGERWLPLVVHSVDAFHVAEQLWEQWLSQDVRSIIAADFDGDEGLAFRVTCFLAACHDIGKATPSFQMSQKWFGSGLDEGYDLSWKPRKAGLPFRNGMQRGKLKHPIASEAIVERYLQERRSFSHDVAESWGSIVGSHHGKPPLSDDIQHARSVYDAELGWDQQGESAWKPVQFEIMDLLWAMAGLEEEGDSPSRHLVTAPVECLICGLVIMSDWVASNADLFPLMPLIEARDEDERLLDGGVVDLSKLEARAERAWRLLKLTPSWQPPDCVGEFDDRWFVNRFDLPEGAAPRPVQMAAIGVARSVADPGIMVIEAPMGEGKTEAALAAAEILAMRFGLGGVCFALPTMATTDAMFGRVHRWLEGLPIDGGGDVSVYLAHGKAQLNEEFQGIARVSGSRWRSSGVNLDGDPSRSHESVVVSDWLSGRKKGMLSSFTICTVDQVLMGALEMKHLPLRQLALAGKVVVIDECHAYDVYMQEYLKRVLEWLGSWRVPVVLLSATLPSSIRDSLVTAYLEGGEAIRKKRDSDNLPPDGEGSVLEMLKKRARTAEDEAPSSSSSAPSKGAYPLITYSEHGRKKYREVSPSSRSTKVSVRLYPDGDDELVGLLRSCLSEGGCAGVICGTVARAQNTAALLRKALGEDSVLLTHARYVDVDRMDNEKRLRSLLGPDATVSNGRRPRKLIVVGTQVLEQSLDIDFDVLVTDVAPVDLIMQRVGRLHRHMRGTGESERPAQLRTARCYIRGVESIEEEGPCFDKRLTRVYEKASLIETLAVLGLNDFGCSRDVCLPSDICMLVQVAYSDEVRRLVDPSWVAAYDSAVEARFGRCEGKVTRAKKCLLPSVRNTESMKGLFSNFVEEDGAGEAKHLEDRGQMAVRDTQETVEVLLVRRCGGKLRLLPWVGDEGKGVELGAAIPIGYAPDDDCAQVLAQCAVRLPLAMCRYDEIDDLIDELEKACDPYVGAWQESYWLAGRLVLALEDKDGILSTEVFGWNVSYSREDGLVCVT